MQMNLDSSISIFPNSFCVPGLVSYLGESQFPCQRNEDTTWYHELPTQVNQMVCVKSLSTVWFNWNWLLPFFPPSLPPFFPLNCTRQNAWEKRLSEQ